VNGALWAAASGVGFGLFQSVNRQAVGESDDAYVSTFLQLVVAAVVLVAASASTQDVGLLGHAPPWALLAFATAGVVHFLLGWTFLNISQQRIGAARTSPLLTLTPVFGLLITAITLGQLPGATALLAIVPMVAGGWLVSSGGARGVGPAEARFGLGCAAMWALSPVLTVAALDGLGSPLLGVTLGMIAAVLAYAAVLAATGRQLRLAALGRRTLAVKLCAGVLVALATWWRWVALDDAAVGVVLALNLLSVPIVLFLAPRFAGRHVEHVTPRVWAGATLVVAGSLGLIAVG
jgi:drug/metabolite transporter (DMT)-like permease